MFDKFSFTKIE